MAGDFIMADNNQPNHTTTSDEMLARRRLLKLGVYVPPAVLGMMIVGGMPTQAVAGSCCPSACQPCINLGNNTNSKKCRKNWKKCSKKRRNLRKKGINCPSIPYPCHRGGGGG